MSVHYGSVLLAAVALLVGAGSDAKATDGFAPVRLLSLSGRDRMSPGQAPGQAPGPSSRTSSSGKIASSTAAATSRSVLFPSASPITCPIPSSCPACPSMGAVPSVGSSCNASRNPIALFLCDRSVAVIRQDATNAITNATTTTLTAIVNGYASTYTSADNFTSALTNQTCTGRVGAMSIIALHNADTSELWWSGTSVPAAIVVVRKTSADLQDMFVAIEQPTGRISALLFATFARFAATGLNALPIANLSASVVPFLQAA